MLFPATTAAYSAIFAVLFVALSVHVVILRGRTGIVHGDGGHELLNRSVRSHANFAEYVPLILLLSALLEGGGADSWTLHLLLVPLLAARIMHPIGMRQPIGSVRQYAWRATSVTITWLVMLACAILLIL
jgi:uncharacterized protein